MVDPMTDVILIGVTLALSSLNDVIFRKKTDADSRLDSGQHATAG